MDEFQQKLSTPTNSMKMKKKKSKKKKVVGFQHQLSTPSNSMNNEESQCISSKFDSHKAFPKIEIDMNLATRILLDEVRKGSPGSKNVVCSPLSLEFALHTVAAGSKGETLKQIMQFIGFKGNQLDSMEDLSLKSSSIMRVTSSNSRERKNNLFEEEEPELSFANGIWVDQRYKLKPSYKELMNSIYKARAENVDFKKQADKLIVDINSWVDDKTKGLIKQILTPRSIGKDIMLILVNALYFKGLWDVNSKFEKKMTKNRDFYMLDGSKISVPFMSRSSPKYLYRAFDAFSVLQLNYKRGDDKQFCMQILLPDERDGLQNLMDKCVSDPGFLNQDFGLEFERFKELRIPKFNFSYMHNDLVDTMKSLGLTLPFERKCRDFTEMVELPPGEKLRVSKIAHKATIKVNESSTEAAAVTEVRGMVFLCARIIKPPTLRFVADHPFLFVIKEINTGAIFFIGAVFNPLLKD